jgi:glutamate dehydrogenase
MLAECGRILERITVWLLRYAERPLEIGRLRDEYGAGVAELMRSLEPNLVEEHRRILEARRSALEEQGAPPQTAARTALLPFLVPACDVVRLAKSSGRSIEAVARTYSAIDARFGVIWLRRMAGRLPTDSAWEKLAVSALVDDLDAQQADLTARVLRLAHEGEAPEAAIERFAESRRPLVLRTEQLLAELHAVSNVDFVMLAVACRQLRSMTL